MGLGTLGLCEQPAFTHRQSAQSGSELSVKGQSGLSLWIIFFSTDEAWTNAMRRGPTEEARS